VGTETTRCHPSEGAIARSEAKAAMEEEQQMTTKVCQMRKCLLLPWQVASMTRRLVTA